MSATNEPPWSYFSWQIAPKWKAKWLDTFTEETRVFTPENLIVAKNNIEHCAPLHIWEFCKKITNPYELVYTYKEPNIPSSVSMIKPLSRSYYKMIEMLQLSRFFEERTTTLSLHTAHVCEGPGGFIEACFEMASRHKIKIRQSHAMTLKSTKPHIPGWRRAQQFLHQHREVRIDYGPDNTGNLLLKENRDAFIANIKAKSGQVSIFTADGGFDFTSNYLAQESSIFPLLLASIYCGFSVLASNGIFILKVFDLYSPATLQLLGWLSSSFNRWTIYKPATSRPCNSEQYFIGQGFRGCTGEDLAALNTLIEFGKMPEKLFIDEINVDNLHQRQATMLEKQLMFLKQSQDLAGVWSNTAPNSDVLRQLWTESRKNAINFCRLFGLYHYRTLEITCDLSLPAADLDETGEEDISLQDGFR
jgi:23S rRNA U2552 (ribose-2'-O)-methylase RlmE/FtsJ